MDLFVIEVRGKAVAIINADDRVRAETFAASLEARRHQMKDCMSIVAVRNATRSEARIWRAAWTSELQSGSIDPEDQLCVWLLAVDAADERELPRLGHAG
jgi:hypothetical protein